MQNLNTESTLQNGKYRIISVLGQGGFGITYLAEHTILGKKVAIKEFFPKNLCDRNSTTSHVSVLSESSVDLVKTLRAKFVKESRNLAKLEHPGIVRIQDVFEENDTAYYVMNYVDGISLSEMVKKSGKLSEAQAIHYIKQVGDALSYIHSKNMLHLDIKPANIMVRKLDDSAVLIDFGLSKQYDEEGKETTLTPTGISHGYAPMEQYRQGGVSEFSPQTDVYSLGATLYYLLTGSVPPDASGIIENGVSLPEDITPSVANAIKKAMKPSRANRYKTVKNFCRTLSKDAETKEDEQQSVAPTTSASNEHPEVKEETQFVSLPQSENEVSKENSPVISEQSSDQTYENEYELEPSKWDKFLNWVCGTSNLVNANQIPNGRKVAYLIALIFLIIAASMCTILGWFFLVAIYHKMRNSLQRLFFASYLDEYDEAADYSKGKASLIVGLIIMIPVFIGVLIISAINRDSKKEVTEYVTDYSANCPINLYDVQVSSASYVDGDIVITCHTGDSVHSNRDYLNRLNIDLYKANLADENYPHYKVAKNNDIIFKFYNNGEPMKSVTLTPKDIEMYKNQSPKERGNALLTSFIALQNAYLPYDLGADVKMTNASISQLSSQNNGKEYFVFNFYDPNNEMQKQFGDSLVYKVSQFLPLNYPYLAQSAADATSGIGIEIYDGKTTNDYIVYTSEEIKKLLHRK